MDKSHSVYLSDTATINEHTILALEQLSQAVMDLVDSTFDNQI